MQSMRCGLVRVVKMLTLTVGIMVVTAMLTGCLAWIASIMNYAAPLPYMVCLLKRSVTLYTVHTFTAIAGRSVSRGTSPPLLCSQLFTLGPYDHYTAWIV